MKFSPVKLLHAKDNVKLQTETFFCVCIDKNIDHSLLVFSPGQIFDGISQQSVKLT